MKIGCCTDIGHYDEIAEAGYQSITLAGRALAAMSEEAYARAARIMRDGPLQTEGINAFCSPALRLNGEGFSKEAVAAYTRHLCGRAAPLGIRYLGVGSPSSRNVPDGYSFRQAMGEFELALAVICGAAAEFHMEVLLEAIATVECNCVTTTKEALSMIKRLSFPNLHLVYDVYHSFMMGEAPSVIMDALAEIRTVHISGYGKEGRPYLSEPSFEKLVPYLKALNAAGYKEEISMEAAGGDIHRGFRESIRLLRQYC